MKQPIVKWRLRRNTSRLWTHKRKKSDDLDYCCSRIIRFKFL